MQGPCLDRKGPCPVSHRPCPIGKGPCADAYSTNPNANSTNPSREGASPTGEVPDPIMHRPDPLRNCTRPHRNGDCPSVQRPRQAVHGTDPFVDACCPSASTHGVARLTGNMNRRDSYPPSSPPSSRWARNETPLSSSRCSTTRLPGAGYRVAHTLWHHVDAAGVKVLSHLVSPATNRPHALPLSDQDRQL